METLTSPKLKIEEVLEKELVGYKNSEAKKLN